MGFIFDEPSPAPVVIQAPPPITPKETSVGTVATEETAPEVEEASSALVEAERRRKGARKTIATGAEGLLGEAPVRRKELGG